MIFFQGTVDSLQERVDRKWTIESELDWRYQLLDIVRMLQSLLGEDKVRCGYILSHIKIAGTSDISTVTVLKFQTLFFFDSQIKC